MLDRLVASPIVRAERPTRAARFLVAFVAVVTACVAVDAGGADRPSQLRSRATELRRETSTLAEQSHAALLQLYALESERAGALSRVDQLAAQAADVRRQRAEARARLRLARRTLGSAQRHLARRVLALYEEGEIDPLAVILGSASVDEALTRLDHVKRFAELDRQIAAEAGRARSELALLSRSLATRETRLDALRREAEAAAASLESARAERAAYVGRLTAQRRLNESQIASLDKRAQEAEQRAEEVAASAPPPAPAVTAAPPAPATAPVVGGRRLTVIATAYSLPGTTASGLPVGPGIVAVDPSVIPMGTRMTIPGYGEGVAADTGSAIIGARIDVWFPTYAQALAWGARTVTITIH